MHQIPLTHTFGRPTSWPAKTSPSCAIFVPNRECEHQNPVVTQEIGLYRKSLLTAGRRAEDKGETGELSFERNPRDHFKAGETGG